MIVLWSNGEIANINIWNPIYNDSRVLWSICEIAIINIWNPIDIDSRVLWSIGEIAYIDIWNPIDNDRTGGGKECHCKLEFDSLATTLDRLDSW